MIDINRLLLEIKDVRVYKCLWISGNYSSFLCIYNLFFVVRVDYKK